MWYSGIDASGELNSRMERATIIVVFLNFFRWESVIADLTVNPRDTEAKVNQPTYLNCSTNLLPKEIHWSHGNNYVYAGGSFSEPYLNRFEIEINNATGAYNLVIPVVEPGDAGVYSCQDDGGIGQQSSAQLIVLADDPLCYFNVNRDELAGPNSCGIEPDELQLSCSVTYHGNIPPQMEWRKVGENASIENVTSVSSGNNVTYVLSLKSDLSMNNQVYVCQTTKSTTSQYQCNTEMIKVQYVFRSVYSVNATVGKEVNCLANSSQSCSYKWKWFKGEDTTMESNNQTLNPTKIGSHRCEASCPLGTRSCTIVVMYAEVYAEMYATEAPTGTNPMGLWGLLAVPVLIIIIIALVRFIKRWRRKNCMKRTPESQDRDQSQMTPIHRANQNTKNLDQVASHEMEKDHKEDNIETKSSDCNQPTRPENTPLIERNASTLAKNPEENEIAQEKRDIYLSNPIYIRTITSEDLKIKGKDITGLTILDKELFVVSKGSEVVIVYDLIKFCVVDELKLENFIDMIDIVSCKRTKCLYILNGQGPYQHSEIVKVERNGELIKRWAATGNLGCLSVTYQSNVVFTSFWENKLVEFSPDKGLPCEISLNKAGIDHPYRAIKLTNGHYLVSNGYDVDAFHRACVVDKDGIIIKVSGEMIGSSKPKMDHPVDLVIDESGFILISDEQNKRILLLDANLQLSREWLTEEHLCCPWKILLDESSGQLFVAENKWNPKKKKYKNGKIVIFRVK